MAAAGIKWVRGFDQGRTASTLAAASANGVELSGILAFSTVSPQTFPVDDLPAWRAYVTGSLNDTRDKVHFWEVWNEPPNFTENKSPAAYATIVAAAYEAAKAADPSVQIGLAAQSVNLNFLAQALDAGAADHFDYVTVHPYETMGLVEFGWEAEYMSIVPTIRKLLADKNPAKRDVPVWFTEVGEPVGNGVTPEHQADTLVKAFVMGIAQGVTRVHWFEPLDGDSGPFGLVDSSGNERPSYVAVRTLTEQLGEKPLYLGWLLLNDLHHGFVFQGKMSTVLVGWAPPGQSANLDFGASASLVDPKNGVASPATAVTLTSSPLLIVNVPAELVARARSNAGSPFPWGGDYAQAASVSFTAPSTESGLHPLGAGRAITLGGDPARDQSGAPAQSFTVDPNFLSYGATPIRITAVLRRNGADSAGFNLKYESTSGWKGTGSWYNVPGDDQWYTQSWTITDPQFVGKWGYNFSFDSDSTDHSKYSIRSVTIAKQ